MVTRAVKCTANKKPRTAKTHARQQAAFERRRIKEYRLLYFDLGPAESQLNSAQNSRQPAQ
jgi:hypothetical protein